MKTFINKFSSKGFTLIELLIVVAIIGILATVLLTTINPVKKVNQTKDSDIKADIAQIANAMQAYYTAKGTAGTASSYPDKVADLVPGELKSEPKINGTTSYTVIKNPSTCTTAAGDCTDIAVYAALNDPVTAGNVWCWRSSSAAAAETTLAACTAP